MNYKQFYNLLRKCNIISPIWEYILDLIETFISTKEDKDNYLILFAIYFSLINDGNICMSLNKEILINKWKKKLDESGILLLSKNVDENILKDLESIFNMSTEVINKYLDKINDLTNLVGLDNKIFVIDDNYLYLNKYYEARKGIIASIRRLYPNKDLEPNVNIPQTYHGGENGFTLSSKQYEAAIKGVNNNLIITGGPGTGKTTSILFILLNLLKKDISYDIKLIAPSGKAASRMKESIINTANRALSIEEREEYVEELNKLDEYEGSTIHRCLDMNPSTSIFKRNKNNRFPVKTIFVIDEASMIDIELFNYLLDAIETGSKVFIMGDKNQLPSVDVGAVFGDLLNKESYLYKKKYVVEIDESKRFPKGSNIYNLAQNVNSGTKLTLDSSIFKSYKEFKVDVSNIEVGETPIYYYLDSDKKDKDEDIVKHIAHEWYKSFYKDLYLKACDLDYEDSKSLTNLFELSEKARILCSQNEGYRGTHYINELTRKSIISEINNKKYKYNYPGELMIIKKNNNLLNLFNGDAGIVVKFKDDDTLYFMVKRSSKLIEGDGKLVDKIFKKDTLYFYPLRLIAKTEIDDAYAITIHKSQGSDYENILVILPKNKGNPLLNRQILYTGITRTKKRTYILSNVERLNDAIDNVLTRDTNIII